MTWRRGDLRDELVWELDRHGMTFAVPSATLVTSVTRVTAGQPPWLPTLPTPWGRTNTEIGATLFISPTTASVHIANILPKLGAADRYAAATLARRLGTAPESGQPRP